MPVIFDEDVKKKRVVFDEDIEQPKGQVVFDEPEVRPEPAIEPSPKIQPTPREIPQLRQAPEPSIIDRIRSTVTAPFRQTAEKRRAEAPLLLEIQKRTGLPAGQVEAQRAKLLRTPRITGITPEATLPETLKAGVKGVAIPAIAAGAATAPIPTAVGVASFAVLDKLVDLNKFVPSDASDEFRSAVELVDFVAKAAAAGGAAKFVSAKAPGIIEAFTKQKTVQAGVPEVVKLSRDQTADIFKTGKLTTAEQKSLFAELNLTREQQLQAVRKGVEIDLPTETLITLKDKPVFAKIKSVLGKKPAVKVEKVTTPLKARIPEEVIGEPIGPTKLLPSPEQVATKILKAPRPVEKPPTILPERAQLPAIERIEPKPRILPAPRVRLEKRGIKGPIAEQVGIPEGKQIITTERQALKKQIRDLSKGAREGFRSGKDFQKAVTQQKQAIKLAKQLKKTEDKIEAAVEIEQAVPAPFQSVSSSFNEHVAYFQNKQLPTTSTLRGKLNQIRVITRLRSDKKIPAGSANRKLKRLRKEIFDEAKKEGVAIRMTDGGKIVLAVRESGIFVPTEFAEYKKFTDVSAIAGGGTDITRTIQGIDGALSVAEKLKVPGQAGQAEQNVLWPTRDMSIQKLSFINEKSAVLKKMFEGVKPNSERDLLINKVAEEISLDDLGLQASELAKKAEIKKLTSNQEVINAAKALRQWYTDTLAEMNALRDIRGQDRIPVRNKYVPQEFLDMTIWERFGRSDKVAKDIFEGKGNLPDYIKPNKPFNPREKAREFGIPYDRRVKSAIELAESYLATAGKDIFNTSIIQNNKAFIQQLETMGFKKSASTLADWNAEAFAGVSPVIDKAVKLPAGWKKGLTFFNRLRNMSVFPFNFSWNLLTQTSSLTALTTTRFGALNTIKGVINWALDPRLREQTSKDYYSFIIKSFKGGRLSRQDVKNLMGEEIKIYKTPKDIVEDAAFLINDNIERILTGASIEAARLEGTKRGLTGEALKNFASDGGGKTQSMYNDEDKPGVLRSLVVKTSYPYQTFAFEVQNTFREWLGKTGTPPSDAKERLFWLIRFMAGTAISASLAKKFGKKLWDWKRPPLPFAEQWLSPIISKINGEYYDAKRLMPSPVQMTARFAEGIDNVLEKGDWRKLRNQMITWAPGLVGVPAGVQAARMVDSWIAYSEGGIFDRGGKKMFSVENEADLLAGMFAGVWSTEGGQEYIEKRKSEPLFKTLKVSEILDNIAGKSPTERRKEKKRKKRKSKIRKRPRRFVPLK